MKRRILCLILIVSFLLSMRVFAADETGYLFQTTEAITDEALLNCVEAVAAEKNLYRTEDFAVLQMLGAAGRLLYWEEDILVMLTDLPEESETIEDSTEPSADGELPLPDGTAADDSEKPDSTAAEGEADSSAQNEDSAPEDPSGEPDGETTESATENTVTVSVTTDVADGEVRYPGDTFTVTVTAAGTAEHSADVTLTYDKDLVELVSVPADSGIRYDTTAAGMVRFITDIVPEGECATLAALLFRVKTLTEDADTVFSLTAYQFATDEDIAGEAVDATPDPGSAAVALSAGWLVSFVDSYGAGEPLCTVRVLPAASAVEVPAKSAVPTPNGYSLAGWADVTAADNDTIVIKPDDTMAVVTGNATFKAVFKPNLITPQHLETDMLLGMDYVKQSGITGEGVRIGLIDSGVRSDFAQLTGANMVEGTNYLAAAGSAARTNTNDAYGHGSFVAAVLVSPQLGIAPGAELVPLKCFDGRTGKISYIIEAIYDAVDVYQVDVLNMSLGTSSQNTSFYNAVRYAFDHGVIITAATGNLSTGVSSTGNDPMYYPAAYQEVVGVGAVDASKTIAQFSYQNDSVLVTAPGKSVVGLNNKGTDYVKGNGTSFAAPFAAGAAALALSVDPSLTPLDFMDLLAETAEDLGEPGQDRTYGYGLMNVGLLLAVLREDGEGIVLSGTEGGHSISAFLPQTKTGYQVMLAQYDADGRFLRLDAMTNGTERVIRNLPLSETAESCTLFILEQGTWRPIYSESRKTIER